ncbi:MAG TPA: NADH-quinone oxidoreductase subunit J [Actinomycetota bacterium]
MGEVITFWITATVSVGAAAFMLFQRNAVHAALLLILNQFTLAVLFVLLDAPFLAAVQVIVYAGAIMVLFLFVIMFLGVDRREVLRDRIRLQRPAAIALWVFLVAAVIFLIQVGVGLSEPRLPPASGDNVRAVARVLFTDFVFPFEVTSVLLIVAAIAAMVLARRTGEEEAETRAATRSAPPRPEEPV